MSPLCRYEMRLGMILVYRNKSRLMITIISYLLLYHDYYFSRGRLYYTWKPKDIRAATVILFNYEIF